ncbi:MAG: SRPBCC domain-containing protein [Candidatus Thermoplasmatota archaeon]|jgi:carbon monoxide dehydrogenase subunit G|uniref:CoxG family protein n=1 Tax=Ferroplasma sp. TaxID=2591003 RepID=UPI00260B741E|nr:SRPBCC domain-containing protein [Ferroplasma sp.]MCL4311950.1 SRPBCC domain-containing protein [Candidatus Thermoplasmatota archaeon]
MEFSGKITIATRKENVAEFFSSIDNIAPCLPGVYDFQNNGNEIQCKLKLDISAAKISAMNSVTGKMSFSYSAGTDSLNIDGSGRITGSKVKFTIGISYEASGEETILDWKSSFDFGLIVKIMGRNNVDEISRQNIDKTMECITGKLNLQ